MSYTYNADGQAVTVTDTVNGGQSVTAYAYDQLNRLSSATAANWNMAWTYDEFGNRLTQTGSSGVPTSSLSYNDNNRITTTGYTYDSVGNMTLMPGVNGFGYDAFDRMSSVAVV